MGNVKKEAVLQDGEVLKKTGLNRSHDLSIEEVKSSRQFAHFKDEHVLEIIKTIKRFSEIVYDFYKKSKGKPACDSEIESE